MNFLFFASVMRVSRTEFQDLLIAFNRLTRKPFSLLFCTPLRTHHSYGITTVTGTFSNITPIFIEQVATVSRITDLVEIFDPL